MKRKYVLCLVMAVGLLLIAASAGKMQDNNPMGIRNQAIADNTSPLSSGPILQINRNSLYYGVTSNGLFTGTQYILVHNTGGGTMSWTATDNATWLECSPASGTNFGVVDVSLNLTNLPAGTSNALITITAPGATNSPQTVSVTAVRYGYSCSVSIGSFDTPVFNSVVNGAVPFTGWVVNRVEVQSVKIYEKIGSSNIYIGDATFVDGARPDIPILYPNYPKNYMAGWGYLMLTNVLPDGPHTFEARVTAAGGCSSSLGIRNVTIANANRVKPFGNIDTPCPGCSVSGNFCVSGWALAAPFNTIENLRLYIDGVFAGVPVYGSQRPDIPPLFPPSYLDRDTAGFNIYVNSTPFTNNIHTIAAVAWDNESNQDGIGSRYFNIWNLNTYNSESELSTQQEYPFPSTDITEIPLVYEEPIGIQKGFSEDSETQLVGADEKGQITIMSKELERIVVQLNPYGDSSLSRYYGYYVFGKKLMPLPIGSTLDRERGIFYWLPGPGFVGTYRFLFVQQGQTGELGRKLVTVKILPKFTEEGN